MKPLLPLERYINYNIPSDLGEISMTTALYDLAMIAATHSLCS